MDSDLVRKLNASVEFIQNGGSFRIGNLVLSVSSLDLNTVSVIGSSSFIWIANISKEIALKELNEIKREYNAIKDEAEGFVNYIKGKKISYELVVDTGTAGVLVCREKDGVMKFTSSLKE